MVCSYGFSVELLAETASFRDPGGQLYHSTFPLPPVSTIVGIAGAALGFSFQQVWEYSCENMIAVGVKDISLQERGKPPGKGLDLWKYQKIVTKEVRSDILKREFIFQPAYRLYYSCRNLDTLEVLNQAFRSPAWALSLGTSDDLALIKEISPIEQINEIPGGSVDLSHSLIPGDQSDNFLFNWEVITKEPIAISLALPMVKKLPVQFFFETNGKRKGSKYQTFTFLAEFHSLKNPCPAYSFGHDIISLFQLENG
ncbi:MAG: CRISPR-associated protein Cas5 [Thermoanaerobacteraceae bacterium]|nr:CRISPR-associated protein Cas5 [Thermoanaerobacteraceae bacterium]